MIFSIFNMRHIVHIEIWHIINFTVALLYLDIYLFNYIEYILPNSHFILWWLYIVGKDIIKLPVFPVSLICWISQKWKKAFFLICIQTQNYLIRYLFTLHILFSSNIFPSTSTWLLMSLSMLISSSWV